MANDFEFELVGTKETLAKIEKTLGKSKVRTITRKAVNAGTTQVRKNLEKDMEVFRDTGATIDEVVQQNARVINDNVESAIGWNGPKQRSKIIHLSEFGYTKDGKQIRPRGFGVITKSINRSEKDYFETVATEVKKQL